MQARILAEDTSHLSDEQFEALILSARRIRSARNAAIAYERQMHTATFGLSHEVARRDAPGQARLDLIAAYGASGMTASEIQAQLQSLGLFR
jgi:hypothetical protein